VVVGVLVTGTRPRAPVVAIARCTCSHGNVKVKCSMPHDECRRGTHLTSLGRELVDG